MAKFRFTRDFDFNPAVHKGQVTIAYKAGQEKTDMTREAIAAAKAAGVGKIISAKSSKVTDEPQG